ncbi:hypothetical protein [Nannocystis pusilla]|uniref:Uncharacterized protein n=1 Tax=Nannocystis pusilla TaxID=889268 RepID=A0ABS7U4F5_9BACT|nr:hypothetical protein [Nannocystis pusilla]MBZ5715440.1 hypothetical protein [Nannocystis pusilla]
MARMPPVVLVLALVSCRDDDGPGGVTIVTGVTSNVTTLTPETTSTTTSTTGGASGSEGASGSTSTTTDPVDATGASSSTTTTTGYETTAGDVGSSTTGPPDPVEACLEKVDPGDECSACICTDCLELWDACHDDQACAIIQECAQESSCYGIDCLEACETTINLWGGIGGTSFGLWLPMTNCLEASCRRLCPW